jgi:hypothetical protein
MSGNAMTPEQWESLQQLLQSARQLTGLERESFVQQILAQDPELGSELKELLACEAMAADFLEAPVWNSSTEMVGQTLGHYRILEKPGPEEWGRSTSPKTSRSRAVLP